MPRAAARRYDRDEITREDRTIGATEQAVRLLHITDLHLFANSESELRGTNTDKSLRAVLGHIADSDWVADATLVTGDLIQDDTLAAYHRCRDYLAPLPAPITVCPGNHDIPELMDEVFTADCFRINGQIDAGDWRVVTLPTWVDGGAWGALDDAELERLEAACRTDRHVLVALHHPTVDLGSRWLDGLKLANRDSFDEIIKSTGSVRCVLFGHAHQEYDHELDGTRYLCTPSTCRQFLPGSDVFATDDRPPAYRRLQLNTDGSVTTNVEWVSHD